MPIKLFTPSRVGVITITALVVSTVHLGLNNFENCKKDVIAEMLRGPLMQDDPGLVSWVKTQMVPPSTNPYNLQLFQSGLEEEVLKNTTNSTNNFYSISQEFIISSISDLFGDQIHVKGIFLEVGAYDGEFLSNTLFLEREFGWRGILIEPHPTFFEKLLLKNRKSWALNACLNTKPWASKEFFSENERENNASTHHCFNCEDSKDVHNDLEAAISQASSRLSRFTNSREDVGKYSKQFEVQCIPLYTIMLAMNIKRIDFLSLDIEKAEMGVLDTIPWDKVSFSVLAIEHVGDEDLIGYMKQKGYYHVVSQGEDYIFANEKLVKIKN